MTGQPGDEPLRWDRGSDAEDFEAGQGVARRGEAGQARRAVPG